MAHSSRFLCLAVLLGSLAGCGGASNPNAPATITGKVTYKGAVVPGGNLTFHGTNVVYPAVLASDGTYIGRDFPIGDMIVTLDTEVLNPNRLTAKQYPGGGKDKMAKQIRPTPEGTTAAPAAYVKIPAKYADKTMSGLTVTLKSGKQVKDFELTD